MSLPETQVAVPTVHVLRELFRHYQAFKVACTEFGLDTLRCPDGTEWSIWDLEYLIGELSNLLTQRQAQVIQLCLIEGHREIDAAIMLGVSPTNPVMKYATSGIESLIHQIADGKVPRFKPESVVAA